MKIILYYIIEINVYKAKTYYPSNFKKKQINKNKDTDM